MIKLLKNAEVYSPNFLGKKDVLIAGDKIFRIEDEIKGYDNAEGVEIFDMSGMAIVPGYVDKHVHILGGGGEQGPASLVPEPQVSSFVENGVTTAVGLLGIDGIYRSNEQLVGKARALTEDGITVYTLTSNYAFPPTTITESIERDIVLITPMGNF